MISPASAFLLSLDPSAGSLQIFLLLMSRRSLSPRAVLVLVPAEPSKCLKERLSYPSFAPDDLQATSRLYHTRDEMIWSPLCGGVQKSEPHWEVFWKRKFISPSSNPTRPARMPTVTQRKTK